MEKKTPNVFLYATPICLFLNVMLITMLMNALCRIAPLLSLSHSLSLSLNHVTMYCRINNLVILQQCRQRSIYVTLCIQHKAVTLYDFIVHLLFL